MKHPGLEARRAAVNLMTAVTEEHRLLSELLPDAVAALPVEERARAGRLALGALRWSQRADRLVGPFLRNRPEDAALNAMRLALYEINVAGAPDYAAVNAAVALAPKSKAKMINAVLRNVQRTETAWAELPIPTVPKWLRKRLIAAWGKEATIAIEAAHAGNVPLDLTPKNGDATALAALVSGDVLPTGSVRIKDAGQVSELPGYADGLWWVQDAAATLPAQVLAAKPGETILDLCAAPGGKTMQLAATGADVTALDSSAKRMERVTENLTRTGLTAKLVTSDALTWSPDQRFDAVLLDAPCSATGTIRRHPDLVHAKDGSEIAPLCDQQSKMIDAALKVLKPGGRLIYCTCSLLPDEGEDQIAAALKRHAGLSVDSDALRTSWLDERWLVPGLGLRIRPDHWADRGGIDGFFITALRNLA